MNYDSEAETRKHIKRVGDLLGVMSKELINRAIQHDLSKLTSPEKEAFDEYTPILKQLTYGSKEYNDVLDQLSITLNHHYRNNRHHPEYFVNGISGMTLVDLIEMFCDWKAASERHGNGDIFKSIKINKARFLMSDQLTQIFINTADAIRNGE